MIIDVALRSLKFDFVTERVTFFIILNVCKCDYVDIVFSNTGNNLK